MSKVAFTGDREWIADEPIREIVESLPDTTLFVLGDARGLDTEAKEVCEELGRPFIVEEAHWALLGKYAGHERNGRMLDHLEEGDRVFAFHDNLDGSKGTKNCVKQALDRGMQVCSVTSTGRMEWLEPDE